VGNARNRRRAIAKGARAREIERQQHREARRARPQPATDSAALTGSCSGLPALSALFARPGRRVHMQSAVGSTAPPLQTELAPTRAR
jgi:hypothetical protein